MRDAFIERLSSPLDGVVGNGPILVDTMTGEVHRVPSGGWKRWVDASAITDY